MIDGASAFVVPGFVDMHAHLLQQPHPDDALTLMLAFGITGWLLTDHLLWPAALEELRRRL